MSIPAGALVGCLLGAAVLVRPQRVRAIARLTRADVPTPGAAARPQGLLALRARARSSWHRLRTRTVGPAPATSMTTADVLGLVDDLATQMRAGAAPTSAWRVAVELRPHAIDSSEQPRHALTYLASASGVPVALRALHAAWSLSEDVGAPLAEVLRTVAAGIRQDVEVEADIETALAAPRSTARLLAVLPLAGLGLGELIGAHPLAMLAHTGIGRVCAVLGLALTAAGQWWTRRLVARTTALL